MSVVDYALTTRARAKTFLDISGTADDDLIDRLINAVTDFVERFCDRRFKQTDYSNEVYDGNGTNRLFLRQYPVVSGKTFTLERRDSYYNEDSWSTIDSEHYFVKEDEGIIIYVGGIVSEGAVFVKAPQHYRVTYTAGYNFDNKTPGNTLEDVGIGDLEVAVWKLIGKLYNNRKLSTDVKSERLGDYAITLQKEGMIEPEVMEILLKYKRPYEH